MSDTTDDTRPKGTLTDRVTALESLLTDGKLDAAMEALVARVADTLAGLEARMAALEARTDQPDVGGVAGLEARFNAFEERIGWR